MGRTRFWWAILGQLPSGPSFLRRKRNANPSQQGFALLIVLVTLATLSLLWGAVLAITRQSTQEASARLSQLNIAAALDGALNTVAFDLSLPHATFDGVRNIRIGSAMVDLQIRPETAKIDLNYAPPSLISGVLRASGLREAAADRLAREITEVRLRAVLKRQDGPDSPHAGRLESLADLISAVPDGRDLFACLGPDATLFTRTPDVAVHWASDRVHRAAVAFDPQRYKSSNSALSGIVGGDAGRPNILEITESIPGALSPSVITRQVVIRLTGNPNRLYWIMSDRSPAPSEEAISAACARLAAASG